MSRPLFRLRPPADDDLQAATEEEMRKRPEAAPGTAKLPPTVPPAGRTARENAATQIGPHAADRSA
jgi:hypothetical protein